MFEENEEVAQMSIAHPSVFSFLLLICLRTCHGKSWKATLFSRPASLLRDLPKPSFHAGKFINPESETEKLPKTRCSREA